MASAERRRRRRRPCRQSQTGCRVNGADHSLRCASPILRRALVGAARAPEGLARGLGVRESGLRGASRPAASQFSLAATSRCVYVQRSWRALHGCLLPPFFCSKSLASIEPAFPSSRQALRSHSTIRRQQGQPGKQSAPPLLDWKLEKGRRRLQSHGIGSHMDQAQPPMV